MQKKGFSSSLKLGRYRMFLKSLSENQKELVKSCGFGSLLHFDCSEAPRSLCFKLAKSFNVPTRSVQLENGSKFTLDALTVSQMLGIPLGGRRVPNTATKLEKQIIANDTETITVAPTVDHLLSLVTSELTGDKFVRIFMLISLAIFLCPTSYGSASSHYYAGIVSVKDIANNYDWYSFTPECG